MVCVRVVRVVRVVRGLVLTVEWRGRTGVGGRGWWVVVEGGGGGGRRKIAVLIISSVLIVGVLKTAQHREAVSEAVQHWEGVC